MSPPEKKIALSDEELRVLRWALTEIAWIPDRYADQIRDLTKKFDAYFKEKLP